MTYQGYEQCNVHHGPMPSQITTVTRETTYGAVDRRGCLLTGKLQMLLGSLSIIFGIVAISIDCQESDIATPIWAGAWFIVGGAIGCRAAGRVGYNAYCTLIWYVTLNIFSMLYSINIMITMGVATSKEPIVAANHKSSRTTRIAIDSVLIVIASAELIATNAGAIVAFRTINASKTKSVVMTRPIMSYTTLPSSYPTAASESNYFFNTPPSGDDGSAFPKTPPPSYGTIGPSVEPIDTKQAT